MPLSGITDSVFWLTADEPEAEHHSVEVALVAGRAKPTPIPVELGGGDVFLRWAWGRYEIAVWVLSDEDWARLVAEWVPIRRAELEESESQERMLVRAMAKIDDDEDDS